LTYQTLALIAHQFVLLLFVFSLEAACFLSSFLHSNDSIQSISVRTTVCQPDVTLR